MAVSTEKEKRMGAFIGITGIMLVNIIWNITDVNATLKSKSIRIKLIKNSQFDTAIKDKLKDSADLSAYEKEEISILTQIKQLTAAKEKLGVQIDRLDFNDKHYEMKYSDMQKRLDALYDELAEANDSLKTVQMLLRGIHEQQIFQENIFQFLKIFDIIYDKFSELEKKEFLHSFIKKIEIYPEPQENGQISKSIEIAIGSNIRNRVKNKRTTIPNDALMVLDDFKMLQRILYRFHFLCCRMFPRLFQFLYRIRSIIHRQS